MKRYDVLIVLFLFVFTAGNTQQKAIDSLEEQLRNPTNGKSRLENLVRLGHSYIYVNPQRSIEVLDEAIKIANEKKDFAKIGEAYVYKGTNHFVYGQDSLAFSFYDKAESTFKAIDSSNALARLLFNKASLYTQRKRHLEALTTYQEAHALFIAQKDSVFVVYSKIQIGKEYWSLGRYTSSMQEFTDAQAFLVEIGQTPEQKELFFADLNVGLGALNVSIGKYDEALLNFKDALSFFKKNGYKYREASQYLNISEVYGQHRENYTQALNYIQKAHNIFKITKNVVGVSNTLGTIGKIHYDLKQYSKSLVYIDSAIFINKNVKEYGLLAENYKIQGDIFIAKKQYENAKRAYNYSLNFAGETNEIGQTQELKLRLSGIAARQGDFKVAYTNLEEARILRDSLLSDEKKEELAVLKAKYEFDKQTAIIEANFQKEQTIEKARTERQIFIRNLSIGGGVLFIVLLLAGFLLWRKKREADYGAQLSASKLQSLKAQINPHFIFNTLSSIHEYMFNNEKEATSDYLIQFSKLIRKTLENTEQEEVSLVEEVELLKNYVGLEQKRFRYNFTFLVNMDNDIKPEVTLLPPSLLQPFLENSIWHGFSEEEDGVLSVSFKKEENNLICTIEDNGKGFENEVFENPLRKSFGLKNVKDRLRLLNQSQQSNAYFEIKNKEKKGVKVTIRLPFILST